MDLPADRGRQLDAGAGVQPWARYIVHLREGSRPRPRTASVCDGPEQEVTPGPPRNAPARSGRMSVRRFSSVASAP